MIILSKYDELGPSMGFESMTKFFEPGPYPGKEKILDYLRNGEVHAVSASFVTDVFTGERVNYKLNLITLDVMQELPLGVGLKSSQANLGMSIVETPIDFNLDRPCTKEELNLLIKYCMLDCLKILNTLKVMLS